MKKYFEKQLNNGDLVTEENLPKLIGHSFFGSKYKVGDQIFSFLLKKPIGKNSQISFQMIIEEEFKKLEEEYNFIDEYTGIYPIFIKKEK